MHVYATTTQRHSALELLSSSLPDLSAVAYLGMRIVGVPTRV